MRPAGLLLAIVLFPALATAENSLSRREGFLKIWETVERPAEDTREEPFEDVRTGERGYREITYAKRRGIIGDGERFNPDAPLTASAALLWMLRSRNVSEVEALSSDRLGELSARYGLPAFLTPDPERPLSEAELLDALRVFDQFLAAQVHEVSLYSEKFHGKGTAFGEAFDMHALTAAHRTYPHNTLVRVTNVENGKSVTVRINDRGPFVEGRDMDLSLAGFTTIAERAKGVIRARFERLGDVNLVSQCRAVERFQKRLTRDVRFEHGVPHFLKRGESLALRANAPFVVKSVTYPDGNSEFLQNWILTGEAFSFTPSITGSYTFRLGTVNGRTREMVMNVVDCSP